MSENYLQDAANDAAETVRNFADEILEQLLDKDEASDDLYNDYSNGDSWHHESHVDRSYNLTDAAELIDQLSDYEETDSGLWEGQQPKEAIGTCAAFTYGNAVYDQWRDLIEKINEEAADIISDYDEKIADAELAAADDELGVASDDDEENPDVETLKEEKEEALRKLIDEAADNA